MAFASGANAKLIRVREAQYGTVPAGADWQLAPFYAPLDFGADQALLVNPLIGLAASRDDGDAMPDAVTAGATVDVPLDLATAGWWLCLVLGLPTTTGAAPDFVHTWRSGGSVIPSDCLELGFPDAATPMFQTMTGVQGTSLEINASPTGRPTMRVGIIGKAVTRAAASHDASPGSPGALEQFRSFQGQLRRNAAPLARATAFSLTYNNNLEGVRSIGSGEDIEESAAGGGVLTGSLGIRVADPTLFADAESKAPLALDLGFTAAPNKSIAFGLPRIFLPRKRTAVQGKAGIQATFDLRGSYDAATGAALQVVLRNQVPSYA